MPLFQSTSIKRKQMVIIMLTTGVALMLACAAIGAYEVITFRRSMVQHLTTLAEMVDSGSAAALDFGDSKAATETLGVLKAEPSVAAAWIYDKNGRMFAEYGHVETEKSPAESGTPQAGSYFTNDRLVVVDPIDSKDERVGTVYIVADVQELYFRLTRYATIAGGVFAISLLIAFLMAGRLQKYISEPILSLVQTARAVARERDYSVRVARHTRDEIGVLIDGFNEMLSQIQERDVVLQKAHGELEKRVAERTQELASSLSLIHATLEATADGILVADGAGQASHWNEKFVTMWKIPAVAMTGGNEKAMLEIALPQLKDPDQFVAKIESLYGKPEEESFDILEFNDGRVFERTSKPQRIGDRCVGRVWSFRDITEHRRSENELRWKSALLEAQLESSLDGILVVDQSMKKIFQNRRVAELWKLPPEIVNDPDDTKQAQYAMSLTRDPQTAMAEVHRLYANPTEATKLEMELKDGTWLDRHSYPIIGKDGTCYGRIWSFRDITDRKRAEQELSCKTAVLEAQLESSYDGIIVMDPTGRRIFQNKRVAELWKIPREVSEDPNISRQIQFAADQTSNPKETLERIARVNANPDEIHQSEVELLDGTCMDRYSYPIVGRDGTRYGRIWSFRDITQRKHVETELARERDLLETLLHSSPDYIYFKDSESRFLRCSQSLAGRFGLTPADLIGKTDFDIYGGEHAGQAFEDERQIIQSGKPIIGKIEKETRKDGDSSWVLTSKMPLRDKDGNIIGTFGTTKDITELKKTEADLARERDLLETLLHSSPDYIYFKDTESRFLRCSRSLARRLGVEAASLAGKSDFDLYTEEHARPAFDDEQNIIRSGEPVIGKVEKEVWINGKVTWVITNKMPLRDKDGQIIGTFGTSKDITEMKEAETKLEHAHRQLLETSRLAGMAEVATSVLHNVGNVLNSVNVSCSVVADRVKKSKSVNLSKVVALLRQHEQNLPGFFAEDPKGRQLPGYLTSLAEHIVIEQKDLLDELALLGANVEHIKQIVAMQQSYSKVSGVRETLPAETLVEDALRMNGAALERHQIKVVREYDKTPPVEVEKHKVLQILINLIRNAKYACDDSGRSDKQLTLRICKKTEHMVNLTVSDNGVGIPPENLTRIFEHGFTTRKEGHGFGLHSGALAAKDLGGTLTVESAGTGRGATFTLSLPSAPEPIMAI